MYFTSGLQIALVVQISPNILISGLENGTDLTFIGPSLDNDNLRRRAKFQVNLTTFFQTLSNLREIGTSL